MTAEEARLINRRKADFGKFYSELLPALVDFVEKMGITPAHEVLKQANQYVPYLERALQNMAVGDEADRVWLVTRLGFFVGEYFVQKYGGCWYVNDISGSTYCGRYVVGQFSTLNNSALMLDPFEIAQAYVNEPMPRTLARLLEEVDSELASAK